MSPSPHLQARGPGHGYRRRGEDRGAQDQNEAVQGAATLHALLLSPAVCFDARPMAPVLQVVQKMSRNQKMRKAKKQEKGASSADRRAVKAERDTLKGERRIKAKNLW